MISYDKKTLEDFKLLELEKPGEDDVDLELWTGFDIPCHFSNSCCKNNEDPLSIDIRPMFYFIEDLCASRCKKWLKSDCFGVDSVVNVFLTPNERYFYLELDSWPSLDFYLANSHNRLPDDFDDFIFDEMDMDWGYYLTLEDLSKDRHINFDNKTQKTKSVLTVNGNKYYPYYVSNQVDDIKCLTYDKNKPWLTYNYGDYEWLLFYDDVEEIATIVHNNNKKSFQWKVGEHGLAKMFITEVEKNIKNGK